MFVHNYYYIGSVAWKGEVQCYLGVGGKYSSTSHSGVFV